MKVLYNWLKEFVELTAPPEELRTRLSLSGTAIEALEQTAAGPLLDAELTSNRADCLGHYGIAREAAALYGLPLKRVDPRPRESAEQVAAATRVQIDAPELCGRYTARVLRGVKGRAVARLAAPAPRSARAGFDQQRGGRDQLRDARTRASLARIRHGFAGREAHRGAPRARREKKCARSTASSARLQTKCA